ncbi:pyridoxamine 5'-phosphate oxidase family protein [Streptomyces sp. NPDC101158]|uniref:pyridoxamine 5'-phosphate oxidase family protein n=1 Tax=Streptomyces sp. NPDC101158 TaxID=3366117 RepID=UPI00380BA67E
MRPRHIWLSTAHPDHGPHQVPLWFLWDGEAVWLRTGAHSATARNVREEPRVRLALPDCATGRGWGDTVPRRHSPCLSGREGTGPVPSPGTRGHSPRTTGTGPGPRVGPAGAAGAAPSGGGRAGRPGVSGAGAGTR